MSDDTILFDQNAEGVATITLNRAGARNALNLAMAAGLHDATRRAVALGARAA